MNAKPTTLPKRLCFVTKAATVLATTLTSLLPFAAQADDLKLYGDFRARYENDWDSSKTDGSQRDDRQRFRVRLRGGLKYQINDHWSSGLRIRSGSDDSHQSPHITIKDLDHNDKGDAHFNIDKAFVKAKYDNLWFWAGKNGNPMFKNNEMVWDDDVTVLGGALGIKTRSGDTDIELKGGYFALPVGMKDYAGNLGLLQAVFATKVDDVALKTAIAYLNINADGNDKDAGSLQEGNGSRDYQNWIFNFQAKSDYRGKPLTLAFDYMINSKSYADDDANAFTAFHRDEDNGFVASIRWGDLKQAGHWQLRYDYAHIGALAINNSYAQDDWVRWGNATQTRASNFKGSEFRLAYAFSPTLNLVSRLYIVDAIEYRGVNSLTKEDGNRFRVDLNIKF